MKSTATSALSLLLFLTLPVAAARAENEAQAKPNVLFIAIDDLNDWIGVLGGHPQAHTPNIDRLAGRGLLFTNAHCAAPACNPSRAALMTGIRPSTSGVYLNPMPWRKALPKAVTIPQHLRDNGYHVLGSGKIYHGRYPDPPSWDKFFPSKTRQRPGDPAPSGRPLNGIPRTAHFDWGPIDVNTGEMADSKVVKWVCDQLGKKHDRPFFLACGIFRPHLPWYVPKKFFERYPLDKIKLPKTLENDLADVPPAGIKMAKPQGDHRKVLKAKQWKNAVQGYLASIEFADYQVGRLLQALDASAHKANTIVILWTDHGWHLGEKKHWRKFALWENATRTPLIIAAPGITSPGSRCDRPVSLIDLYPTINHLCSAKPRSELEGTSLLPLLKDPTSSRSEPAITTHGRNNHAVRSQHFRYIRYADGGEELYDHRTDGHEWANVAKKEDYAKVLEEHRRWLPKKNAPSAERDKK